MRFTSRRPRYGKSRSRRSWARSTQTLPNWRLPSKPAAFWNCPSQRCTLPAWRCCPATTPTRLTACWWRRPWPNRCVCSVQTLCWRATATWCCGYSPWPDPPGSRPVLTAADSTGRTDTCPAAQLNTTPQSANAAAPTPRRPWAFAAATRRQSSDVRVGNGADEHGGGLSPLRACRLAAASTPGSHVHYARQSVRKTRPTISVNRDVLGPVNTSASRQR